MRAIGGLSLFLLFLTISVNIVYTPITKIDLEDGAISDAKIYVALFNGQSLKEIPKPYRYRFLVPFLARLVPEPPTGLFKSFEIDTPKVIKYKFGCINALALALTSWIFFFFCLRLGFDRAWSLIGCLLFLTSFFILNYAGLPLVDAASYLFLLACLWALMENRRILFLLFFTVGIFAKETVVLALVYIFFRESSRKQKLVQFVMAIPGLILYLFLRLKILPTDMGYDYSLARIWQTLVNYGSGISPWVFAVLNLFFAFGLLWFWAVKGLRIVIHDGNSEVMALFPILPIVLLIPFLIGSDLGRIWFLGFPVLIPLALYGIRHYVVPEPS